jgi:hypothetical protein
LFSSGFVKVNIYVFSIIPISYLVYYMVSKEKTRIVINMTIILVVLLAITIPKFSEDYFMTERLHLNVRPFISYYLFGVSILLNSFDVFRLNIRRLNYK